MKTLATCHVPAEPTARGWTKRNPELLSYLFFAGLLATTFFV